MQDLTSLEVESFRKMLEQQLVELLARTKENLSALSGDGETAADPLDRAVANAGRENNLRIREIENRLIGQIRTTLQKMDEGTFGICDSCGEDIPLPRLKARPVSAVCIQCKTEMENLEQAMGR